MQIKDLTLRNFRNHINLEISFKDKINLILGENGAGKTNILEAIHLISTTKSAKAQYDRDLVNYDSNFCTIVLNDLSNNLELQILKSDTSTNVSTKKAKVNKTPKSLNYFGGMFNSVLFIPEDVEVVTGSPSARRKYMDMVLIQTSEGYKKVLTLYTKAVRQRNKLLETMNEGGHGFGQIDYWDEQILDLGTTIQKKRIEFFEYIRTILQGYNYKLNGAKSNLEVVYKMNEMSKERMDKYKDTEIAAKTTLVGPHRDDFEILLNNKNIAYFGSRGQQRTALLALKLSEIDFIESKTDEKPVLLLDDIFSELDEHHKNTVLEVIQGQQTIITSTEKPDFEIDNVIEI